MPRALRMDGHGYQASQTNGAVNVGRPRDQLPMDEPPGRRVRVGPS